MAGAHERHDRRDDSSAFNSREFYLLQNYNMPGYGLGAGVYTNSNGEVKFGEAMSLSSENWQLFFQSGRYFIRNWDYGANWQLGLTEDSRSIPRLYPRSGSVGQQWTLNKVNGGYEMINGLWGPGTTFALPQGWPMAAMRSEADGAVWNITNNPSAAVAKPIVGDMLSKVEGFQVLSSSTSSAASTSSATSNASLDSRSSPLPADSTPTSSLPSAPTSSNSSSASTSSTPSISGGAIAGIVVGAVVLFSAIAFALWFLLVKRRQARKGHHNPYEMHGNVAAEKYAHYHVAELPVPPAELACQDKDTVGRAELHSKWGDAGTVRGGR
ncbi:hypothetical protein IQ06DRAFT_289884 [Phaeosphaeriaceae sp. SRC1lsM3a]|nr:hypothetical protein IQ06DRAFT_289884 [Stagonospora sp. SRC1lsM3a]